MGVDGWGEEHGARADGYIIQPCDCSVQVPTFGISSYLLSMLQYRVSFRGVELFNQPTSSSTVFFVSMHEA